MQIQKIPLSELIPDPANARKHADKNLKAITGSLKRFGQQKPIVIDKDGIIVAGNGTYEAAKAIGWTELAVVKTGLDKTLAMAYAIADNRSGELAEWDKDNLAKILKSLDDIDFDLPEIGFDIEDLNKFGVETANEGLIPDDEIPEVKESFVKRGEIWQLGEHRLMCGDSTSKDDVENLMAGEKADMVFTDPPYNVGYSGLGQNDLGTIENDDMSDEDFDLFLDQVFSRYSEALKSLGLIYVCHPDSASGPKIAFEQAFARYFHKSSTIIWMKQSAGMGWQDYRCQHEPILYGWLKGDGKHYFIDDRSKTTIWDIGRDAQASYVHPTQKPVALPQEALTNSSKTNELVLDLFLGSGSTLIACEKTNRKCYGMEIDPHYCGIIIERWQQFSGLKALKI